MDAGVRQALLSILGKQGVVADRTRRVAYESDALALMRQLPDMVLLPRNTDETARCMKVLHEAGIPIVPRGAGTGLSGGATPVKNGVVIGTARMRRVLELNAEDQYARVEAGLVNVDMTRACKEHSMFYAPDPSSQKACTIGGNVAENAGGPHCFKYGSTTRHILGLVIVTPEGEILDLSEPHPDHEGYDLVGLFVGSEGLLGIATEITVRLVPEPEVVETLLGLYHNLDDACETVTEIIAAHLDASALEILDRLTIQAVEASVFAAGYPTDTDAVLLIEVEGHEVEVQSTTRAIEEILAKHNAFDVRKSRDEFERMKLWAGRKGAFGAMGRIAPDLYVADVVVPRTRLRELVRRTTDICAEFDLKLSNVFHAGDGNLHPNISYDRRNPEEVERVLEAGRRIMHVCVEAGGSLTGEHGVGLEKREEMELMFTPDDLDVMESIKLVWDPTQRMNPGKLLPQRGCREIRTSSPFANGEPA